MPRRYNVISADSHLDLSPDRWTHRVPTKWRDRAPRRVRLDSGEDAVIMENRPLARIGLTRSVGVPHEELHLQVPTFEKSAGTGSAEKRLREQDQDGVKAEVMFSRIGIIRGIREDAGYLALNHAYNEFLAEEYCATAPDRLMAMGVIPITRIDDAVAELEYCARAGLKGVQLDMFPNGKGHPTQEDDRFWSAAMDLRMPVTSHSNGGSTRFSRQGPVFQYPKRGGVRDPLSEQLFRFCGDAAFAPVQMAFAGVFDRFPDLQIYWAETQIGCLPFALWQIDDHHERYGHMMRALWGLEFPKRPLSHYLRENSLWGFLYDPVGVSTRQAVGVHHVMWGSDFAHAASEWPHSHKGIEKCFAGVSPEERHLMLAGNAVKFFHLDESLGLGRQAGAGDAMAVH